MPEIKWAEMKILDDTLVMGAGYLLDFSDKTMREFFMNEFRLDLDQDVYRESGTSKARRFRTFLRLADGGQAAHVLRALWGYRDLWREKSNQEPEAETVAQWYFAIIERLEGAAGAVQTDALQQFATDETLEQLIAAIKRDADAGAAHPALDRLHTYCMKKFAHLLRARDGDSAEIPDTLNGRLGRYLNPIRREGVRPITRKLMKSSVELMEQFNGIRNNESFAHDNEIVDPAEARFIFDSVVSMLRFLKAHDPQDFGA